MGTGGASVIKTPQLAVVSKGRTTIATSVFTSIGKAVNNVETVVDRSHLMTVILVY